MIIDNVAEFGFGDIRIKSGTNSKIGVIAFNNACKEHEIGSKEKNVDENVFMIIDKADLLLTFTCTESIDVIIETLCWLKKSMMKKGI